MARVLVIDDDTSLLRALTVGLVALGHQVSTASSGQAGISAVALEAPDVVVLDLGLPDQSGLAVCETLRTWSEVPIIVLSAAGDETTKVGALDRGADDYVTKPFSLPELAARIRATLRGRRREAEEGPTTLSSAGLRLDLTRREARQGEEVLALTVKEFDVLAFLVRHAGRTCTYQMILQAVWGPAYAQEASYVHAYVHRLRVKLGDDERIRTVPGVGYRFEDTP
jgi:two-component system KDP operon response regulator KdpE